MDRSGIVHVVPAIVLLLGIAGCEQAAPPTEGTRDQERVVPLQVVEGPGGSVLALVPISIQDQGPFAFALDTGASQSVIDQEIVDQLNLPVVGRTREVTGVFGAAEVSLVRLEQWRAEEVSLPAITAATLDLPEPNERSGLRGLLGSDVLSSFGAITVDYEREVLILRARQ